MLLNLAYRLQKKLWRLLRPHTRGVKVMLFTAGGEIVLIRNSYGRSEQFVLPGGGIHRSEGPEQAARREIREELGCEVDQLVQVSTHYSGGEGKRDTIFLFRARATEAPRKASFEVAEVGIFPIDALPSTTSPATLRRISEHLGQRKADGSW